MLKLYSCWACFRYIDQFSRSLYVEYKSSGIDVQCQVACLHLGALLHCLCFPYLFYDYDLSSLPFLSFSFGAKLARVLEANNWESSISRILSSHNCISAFLWNLHRKKGQFSGL